MSARYLIVNKRCGFFIHLRAGCFYLPSFYRYFARCLNFVAYSQDVNRFMQTHSLENVNARHVHAYDVCKV